MAKILIVEDDNNQRLLYREELEYEGYEVVEARDGMEVLGCMEKESPDAVVLDINMPGMDGLETLGRIHDHNRNIAIILNTAYPTYQERFVTWIADAYVVKSSNLDELKRNVRTALAKRSVKGGMNQ
ncbi:MAG: response regulator [Bacteroidota bacterium]